MGDRIQSQVFLFEAFDITGCTTILGVSFGTAFTLYCLCVRSLCLQLHREPGKGRQARFALCCISLLLFCATGILALNTRVIQLAYITYGGSPGGPLGYEESYDPTAKLYNLTGSILDLVLAVSTMAIQIWRLWTVWGKAQYAAAVTILPLLLLFSYIALDIPVDIVANLMPLDQLGISARGARMMDTARYVVLSGLTTIVTGLIAIRLLLVRRRHIKIMGTSDASSPYLNIVAILIESYILDSVWSLATAISIAANGPSVYLFIANNSTVKVIAYFLVVYRVATGRGWTTQTGKELVSLRCSRGTRTTAGEASGIHSRAPATAIILSSLPIAHFD